MPRPLDRDRIAGVREGKLLLSCAELLLAGGLSAEQVLRLRRVARRKPAPSVLGLFIRPWARRLLEERIPE